MSPESITPDQAEDILHTRYWDCFFTGALEEIKAKRIAGRKDLERYVRESVDGYAHRVYSVLLAGVLNHLCSSSAREGLPEDFDIEDPDTWPANREEEA